MTSELQFTRRQYMAGECDHHTYYAQFGRHLVATVAIRIGEHRIKVSEDPHFNDIPLREWDNLAPVVRMTKAGRLLEEANGSGGTSLSDCVCTLKAAARIIKEESNHG